MQERPSYKVVVTYTKDTEGDVIEKHEGSFSCDPGVATIMAEEFAKENSGDYYRGSRYSLILTTEEGKMVYAYSCSDYHQAKKQKKAQDQEEKAQDQEEKAQDQEEKAQDQAEAAQDQDAIRISEERRRFSFASRLRILLCNILKRFHLG